MADTLRSRDGRYLAVEQDDGNFVVYDNRGTAVWDRWSYKASEASVSPMPIPLMPPLPTTRRADPYPLRVTTEQDGQITPRMYSYWANAFVEADGRILVFCGVAGTRPQFFRVDMEAGQVDRLGALIPYDGTSEGWYFDGQGRVYLTEGPRLRRVNPISGSDAILVDISESHPGCDLWQAHSSDDGRTHSMTVREVRASGPYLNRGTLIVFLGGSQFIEAVRKLDESQVTHRGGHVVIKEGDDNRIITVATGEERWIPDLGRAVGHSDVGDSFVVGEADKPDPGGCVYWDLTQPLTIDRCKFWFPTLNMGYVAVRGDLVLWSNETHLELLKRFPEGGATSIGRIAHGNVGSDYDSRVKANLDPSGRWACFLSNMGTDRQDVYLVEVPS